MPLPHSVTSHKKNQKTYSCTFIEKAGCRGYGKPSPFSNRQGPQLAYTHATPAQPPQAVFLPCHCHYLHGGLLPTNAENPLEKVNSQDTPSCALQVHLMHLHGSLLLLTWTTPTKGATCKISSLQDVVKVHVCKADSILIKIEKVIKGSLVEKLPIYERHG